LKVVDIATPAMPRVVGLFQTEAEIEAVTMANDHAFIAAGGAGVYVVDVSDPPNLVEVGFYDTPDYANAIAVANDLIYVSDRFGGLLILRFRQ